MKKQMPRLALSRRHVNLFLIAVGALGLVIAISLAYYWYSNSTQAAQAVSSPVKQAIRIGADEVQLNNDQTAEVKVGPVVSKTFELRRDAIGIIDFNQDMSVQVFSPYQGRIANLLVQAGADVKQGQVLYTVQIPELATAASTLISTSATLKVATQTLRRAQELYETESISLKELQQNTADQQSAEAGYRTASKALTLFGLAKKDIDAIEVSRNIDMEMPVRSPFTGRVTARAGALGQLVQPGNTTAPLTVSNLQTLWMVASIPETEVASYKLGQAVSVTVPAYADTSFTGKITYISDTADAATHRVNVRAEVPNGKRLLKPQMLANFNIVLGQPLNSAAVPANALAREGDGSISVWVTQEGTRFKRRKVQTGMVQNGSVQITDGLQVGENIAQDKALFLSNLYLITTN